MRMIATVRGFRALELSTVVVHTTSGSSLRGVLVGTYRDSLVLKHAKYLASNTVEDIDGEVYVPVGQVAFVQHLLGVEP